jgi:RNA polymerase sigma-70 factor (ECF subfamily)
VATNACLDELRRRTRRPVPTDDAPDGADTTSPRADHHDPDTATRVDIDAALTRLPLEFRAPVVLRDLCALDYAEIAELLGIPPGTVRSRIARGRRMLMEILGNPDRSGVVQGDGSP